MSGAPDWMLWSLLLVIFCAGGLAGGALVYAYLTRPRDPVDDHQRGREALGRVCSR